MSGEYWVWAIAAGPESTTADTTFAPAAELEELLELLEELLDELLDDELLELDELLTVEELDELLMIEELDELLEYDEPLEPPPPQATKPAVARARRQNCKTRIGFTWAFMRF